MRLVDADAIREEWLIGGENEYVYDANSFLDSIDCAPTADAVTVVHGRWMQVCDESDRDYDVYRCSNCKAHHVAVNFKKSNFCPNCGAKMDLEG